MKHEKFAMGLLPLIGCQMAQAGQIGSVDTVPKWLGPDHRIVVRAFDNPGVQNVTCYTSRVRTGGIKGGSRLVKGTSGAVISYQQVESIELTDKIKNGRSQDDVIFQKHTSLVLRRLQVVHFCDTKCNVLVYLIYSDKVVDGSSENIISAVSIMPQNR